MTESNWTEITQSRHSWEREALDYIRAHFPTHKPYHAWSNFEFIALDGSLNEVDLLVFTSVGFFLIEIKSRPGRRKTMGTRAIFASCRRFDLTKSPKTQFVRVSVLLLRGWHL